MSYKSGGFDLESNIWQGLNSQAGKLENQTASNKILNK
jgi:hypothetical protein